MMLQVASSQMPPSYLYLLLFFMFFCRMEDHLVSPQNGQQAGNGSLQALPATHLAICKEANPGVPECHTTSSCKNTAACRGSSGATDI